MSSVHSLLSCCMEGYARYDSLLSSTHAFPIIYFASIDLDLRCCEAGVNNANILLVQHLLQKRPTSVLLLCSTSSGSGALRSDSADKREDRKVLHLDFCVLSWVRKVRESTV